MNQSWKRRVFERASLHYSASTSYELYDVFLEITILNHIIWRTEHVFGSDAHRAVHSNSRAMCHKLL
jgi:hypothetical protein